MKINKRIKVLDFKLSKILNWGLFWAYKSKFSWSWMEFSEHREYYFWDHVKNIDWKASNKTGEMFVKKYEEERDLNVLFFLDNSDSMNFWSHNITKKDLLLEIFYSLSLSAYYNNDNIWWAILNDKGVSFIDYKKSRDNIYRIIDFLEKNNEIHSKKNSFLEWKSTLNNILHYLITHKINNNLVFILTDDVSNIDEKLLKLATNRNEIVVINIFDYFENNLSDLLWSLTINNENTFLNIDLSTNEKKDKYINNRYNQIEYLKNILEKNRVWYINIDTKSDIFKKLMWYFNKIKK